VAPCGGSGAEPLSTKDTKSEELRRVVRQSHYPHVIFPQKVSLSISVSAHLC
jgi:hypothetical protein